MQIRDRAIIAHVSQVIPLQPRGMPIICAGLNPEQVGVCADLHKLNIVCCNIHLTEQLLCRDRLQDFSARYRIG